MRETQYRLQNSTIDGVQARQYAIDMRETQCPKTCNRNDRLLQCPSSDQRLPTNENGQSNVMIMHKSLQISSLVTDKVVTP